ncbi:LuxR C-terminal-related transcriptional regulator [Amycolatopsis sp. NPDC051371]|uniref:helix-turn-helix transcriptional regulator n=1 Tax=Amycolatopsis sp. NPDC051371 TaxID=3155800 RepID=UPI00341E423D
MSESLTEGELLLLMEVVEAGRRDEPTAGLPWAVLDRLAVLIPVEAISCPEFDLPHERPMRDQWWEGGARSLVIGDEDGVEVPEYWESLRRFEPCAYPERTGDYRTPVRWSDFYTRTQLRSTAHYTDYRQAEGFEHGLHLAIPAPPGVVRKVSLWRGPGRDFSERDRLVLQLLRPHLWELHEARLHRTDLPKLTSRERQVLRLVDTGLGNTEIAHELFISVATVRKHLEHIYDRTGVRTRGAAAALMRDV